MITLTGDVNLARSEKFKSILGETMRFVVVGLVSFFVDYAFFLVLNRLIFNQSGDSHTVLTSFANAIAYCVGVIVNYFLIRWFVFTADYQKENGKGAKAFCIFMLASLIGMILTVLFTGVFMTLFDMLDLASLNVLVLAPDSLGKIAAMLVVTVWNFASKKLFIFK